MENEYQVMNHLQKNDKMSQRAIAERTGLSLGAVNILIKKMVRKGLIKVEKLNSRTMRYILTPKGLQEKASLTYSYIQQSYRQLLNIHQIIDELLLNHEKMTKEKLVLLFGPQDEICEIIAQHLRDRSISYEVYNELEDQLSINWELIKKHDLMFTWREVEEKQLNTVPNIEVVNIMKLLVSA